MNEANFASTAAGQTVEAVTYQASSLSATDTVTSIFFEPGRVFETFRERPRFLIAAILMAAATFAFTALLNKRVGYENIVRAKVEAQGVATLNAAQREQIIQAQLRPFMQAVAYASSIITALLLLFTGGFIYQVGSMVTTRPLSYKQALSVWTYSSLPPTLLIMLLSIVLLFITSTDRIDPLKAGRSGLVRANLGVLVSGTSHPVLATALGALDLFSLYGLTLAAFGLQKVARISSAPAWCIVLTIWMSGVVVRSLIALYTGLSLG